MKLLSFSADLLPIFLRGRCHAGFRPRFSHCALSIGRIRRRAFRVSLHYVPLLERTVPAGTFLRVTFATLTHAARYVCHCVSETATRAASNLLFRDNPIIGTQFSETSGIPAASPGRDTALSRVCVWIDIRACYTCLRNVLTHANIPSPRLPPTADRAFPTETRKRCRCRRLSRSRFPPDRLGPWTPVEPRPLGLVALWQSPTPVLGLRTKPELPDAPCPR